MFQARQVINKQIVTALEVVLRENAVDVFELAKVKFDELAALYTKAVKQLPDPNGMTNTLAMGPPAC